MIKNNRIKIMIGILCVVVLVAVAVVAVFLDSRSPEPVLGIFQTEPTVVTEGSEDISSGKEEDPTKESEGSSSNEDPTKETEGSSTNEDPTKETEGSSTNEDPTKETEGSSTNEDPTKETEGSSTNEDPTKETEGSSTNEDPTKETEGSSTNEDPTKETEGNPPDEEEPTEENDDIVDSPDEQVPTPEDKPSSVIIPTEKDPQTGETEGLAFPCQVPGYGLVIEKLEPYSGMFVENGSNVNAENVAMMMVENNGDFPVEYTQISVEYGREKLLFDISALPVGEKLVVQEKTGKSIPNGKVSCASATVIQRAEMEMSESKIRVTDNGNNTLSIRNLTDKSIPTVRVFYKYYMKEEGIFVGGIAFTVRLTRLGAGGTVTVQPAHYNSQTCRVVMVLTYDTEV